MGQQLTDSSRARWLVRSGFGPAFRARSNRWPSRGS